MEKNGGAALREYWDKISDEVKNDSVNEQPKDVDTHQSIFPTHLRILFVNCLADYTVNLYGLHPSENQLKNISKSAIALVPSLASKCSNNETVIFDSINLNLKFLRYKFHCSMQYLFFRTY